ncbi:hypothetical protein ACFVAJ_17270 [Agromyces sp. NPDC057679]|uniref:hypothetical protein n=1 Tax=Agromyces sp. NPDC057679 TaxID=3346207 RepID=UPI00366C7790
MSGRTRVERRSWLSCACGRIFLGRGPLNTHAKTCTDANTPADTDTQKDAR